ncbi:hypothetical protein V1264_016412 [Littorina saxatilis]|uniref:Paired domain-containing protein n=1 Tax=Littorina saxatilis TaxID=31220 RepID=A0AAN9BP48_9CAEN
MPPRKKLSDLDAGRAIGWLQDGVAARQVAQRLAVAPSVIIRLKQRFHATGRVQERQHSGRPRVTTQREDRFIQRQAMQQRMATANIRQRLQATTNTVVEWSDDPKPLTQLWLACKASSPRNNPDCKSPSSSPSLVHSTCEAATSEVGSGVVYR